MRVALGHVRGWRRLVTAVVVAASLLLLTSSAGADNSPYLNVWVHYDYMVGPGYSDAPSPEAM